MTTEFFFIALFVMSDLLLACGCADFILTWCQSDAKVVVHHRLHPSRHGEGEMLHEGGEEEEKFHFGQVLPETHPLT